ncbi:phosphocarrier protein HPr [Chromatiales bacterium (ex Bugula neritina AB1)]|nr:phosphocarrier protein HPr [Chromatiales bacterium (ex Bugula neritina AB1)]
MQLKKIEIINKLGLHARAAAKLVKLASSFESTIEIEKEDQRVNAKSIMGVMMLAASRGNTVTVYAEGGDEIAALNGVEALINERFGEPE